MDELLIRPKKKNSGLIRFRKEETKLYPKKSGKSNDEESFNKYYEEFLSKRRMLSWGITKKSVEILSKKDLNIYNEFNEENNDESERLNLITENIKKTNQNKSSLSKNISKNNILLINSARFNNEKQKKNENILFTINNDNFEIDFQKDKKNIIPNKNEKTLFDKKINKDKSPKDFRRKKFHRVVDTEEYQDDNEGEIELKIFYEGKGFSINISKKEIFSNCLLEIQKNILPIYKLSDYDILYKLKILDKKALSNEKLYNIIEEKNNSPTFYLRKRNKKKEDKTTVIIENFPSFTDLATELNRFFEIEKKESNFTVDNKGSICKVSFSESEKACSLIIFLTRLKRINPIFKRLKINMDYKLNVIIDPKKLRKKPIKLILPLINKKSYDNIVNRKIKDIKKKITIKNINNYKSRNDYNKEMNINSHSNFKRNKRFESCISLGDRNLLNIESKLIKNKSIENNQQLNYNFKQRNMEKKCTLESKINYNPINYNVDNDEPFLSEASEEKMNLSKLKSTNMIINFSKFKNLKKNGFKNVNLNTYKNDDQKSLSPKIKLRKNNNYYIFDKNFQKKYKL